MSIASRPRVSARIALAGAVALAVTLHVPSHVQAVSLIQLSSDPYTNPQSMHATQVEPDNFAYGSTIVTAVQTGRIATGGASNISWATSTNGGTTWTATTPIARIFSHLDAGYLRSGPLPSAEIDAAGTIYLTWEDCRFEANCSANDIVIKSSADGVTWWPARRIPIDPIGSGVDHFLPGLAVDHATAGSSAHLGLVYYSYPQSSCTVLTCRLDVGYVSSTNGGATWSAPTQLAGPMALPWLPPTTSGFMVGDYMSAAVVNGAVYPVFCLAHARSGSVFDEALYTASGLAISGGTLSGNSEQPVPFATSDRPLPVGPATAN